MSRIALVAKCASSLRLAVLTYGRMPLATWRVMTISVSARNFALSVWRSFISVSWIFRGFFSLAVSLGLRTWCKRRRLSFSSVTPATVSCGWVMVETAWVSFGTLSTCLQLKTPSHFPLNVNFVTFLTHGHNSSFHNFVPDTGISSSHHLINMKFYSCLPSWIIRLSIVSSSFLIVQSQYSLKQNRVL